MSDSAAEQVVDLKKISVEEKISLCLSCAHYILHPAKTDAPRVTRTAHELFGKLIHDDDVVDWVIAHKAGGPDA